MEHGNVIIRFSDVTFGYDEDHITLEEASFSVRENAKVTLMGQNGAGKSTLFGLITGALKPLEGHVHIQKDATIATGMQVMPRDWLGDTVLAFFERAFTEKIYDLDRRIKDVLDVVNLNAPLDRTIGSFSGGQQARLLLAYALIQNPDILLLDEPTNNLDHAGIEHLTGFLMMYPKTVLVISHDADFLNAFTEGVLHLDVFTKKVDQYVGNYYNVVEEIAARVERDRSQNARLLKDIQDRKDKVNFFANKGGKMRKLASKLRDQIDDAEENMVDVRQEDRAINDFTIPCQDFTDFTEAIVKINSVKVIKNHEAERKEVDISLRRKQRLFITGPNGIGKSTLLKTLAEGKDEGVIINSEVRVGYYRQDFSGLDYGKTAYDTLWEVMEEPTNERLRSVASQFLLTSKHLKSQISLLSEGQKGLLCFARFVLQRPGLLILDEPTNHINFRHLPIIAKAIEDYEGAVILVSHIPEFVDQITITDRLALDLLK